MNEIERLALNVRRYAEEHRLFAPDDRLALAVSGGRDSMVLLDLLHRIEQPLHVVHVHHGLHEAADETACFVREACDQMNVSFELVHVDVEGRLGATGESLEEAARMLRYEALARAARGAGCGRVATGHHRDDQSETVLLNLFRGTGPEGLAGMAPRRELEPGLTLVRPLLGLRSGELHVYARERRLSWKDDPTNTDRSLRRNALRLDVLPRVTEAFGTGALENVARMADLMRSYLDASWRSELEERFDRCVRGSDMLDVEVLARQPRVWRGRLVLEALDRWLPEAPRRQSVAEGIVDLLESQPGRRMPVEGGTVWRDRHALRFVPTDAATPSEDRRRTTTGMLTPGEKLELDGGTLRAVRIDHVPADLDAGADVAYVDADDLALPLEVRPWRDGDRLQPLGMEGTRLVSDVLTDAQVPPSRRRRVLVVLSEDEIVWVVGHRMSHRFRVHASTKRVVKLAFEAGS